MRFMMIMIPSPRAQEDWGPKPEDVAAMGKYNKQLKEAGVLLALDGLHETGEGRARGVRRRQAAESPTGRSRRPRR